MWLEIFWILTKSSLVWWLPTFRRKFHPESRDKWFLRNVHKHPKISLCQSQKYSKPRRLIMQKSSFSTALCFLLTVFGSCYDRKRKIMGNFVRLKIYVGSIEKVLRHKQYDVSVIWTYLIRTPQAKVVRGVYIFSTMTVPYGGNYMDHRLFTTVRKYTEICKTAK
jgi:hypothetical protein